MITSFINFAVIIPLLFFSFALSQNQPNPRILVRPQKIDNKGIYITANTAGLKQRRAELVKLIEQTELNSIVIDLKDYSGRIFVPTDIALAKEIGSENILIPDISGWLKELKEKGIYTIARITVFQDPYLAEKKPEISLKSKAGGVWHDFKGLSWVDPTQKIVWKYNLDLAKVAVKLGFDEVNFDYVRFPSDGDIKDIVYANLDNTKEKSKVMAEFYRYMGENLSFYPIITSADLFGMVLWRSDGLNIGQRLEDAAPYFDYICPMVYPSHFPAGFDGFANPAEHPYEIINKSLLKAKDKMANVKAKLRPWLQDFNLGAKYTPDMIVKQKQATYDAGATGWILWNAANRYDAGGLDAKK